MPRQAGAKQRRGGSIISLPWRRGHHSVDATGAPQASVSPAVLQHDDCLQSPADCTQRQTGGAAAAAAGAGAGAGLADIVGDVARWQRTGQEAVASLRERIDDMWLDELMLGCDTELFSRVRQAAIEIEGGAEPEGVVHRAIAGAEEAEDMALKSLQVRLSARDCVAAPGGAKGMESRIRQLRKRATSSVMPHILLLRDSREAKGVRLEMESQLEAAQEEFVSINAMKTAKSEVMIELQDESSEREWMMRQLASAVEFLEASQLQAGPAQKDIEQFFTDSVGSCQDDDPLRRRAVQCMEVLQLWGGAAAQALAKLGEGEAEAVAERKRDEGTSKRPCGHLERPARLASAAPVRASSASALQAGALAAQAAEATSPAAGCSDSRWEGDASTVAQECLAAQARWLPAQER
mmetsp:Transcript_43462/g.138353  ORF Transcript_43462/g.138353 Transcript_43462/m.138353 type:complete len:408 (+) Transcript_43462:70-1293(+)